MNLTSEPGLEPPPGVISDFNNPNSLPTINLFVIIICLSLSTILVIIQLSTKHFLINDTAVLAWSLLIPYCVLGIIEVVNYGAGRHQWDVTLAELIHFSSLANAIEVIYHFLILTTKISVLLQFLRIFVPHRNKSFYLACLLIGINVIINISLALSFAFQCLPRRKLWIPNVHGRCIDLGAAFLASATTNTITDFAVFFLPLYSIWELQLPWQRKVGVSAVFAVGLFACVSSIMRLVSSVRLTETRDLTYALSKAYLWALAEVTSGLLCGCFPVLPKLFAHLTGRVKSSFHSSSFHDPPTTTATKNHNHSLSYRGQKPYIELSEREGTKSMKKEQERTTGKSGSRGSEWAFDIEDGDAAMLDGYIYKTSNVDVEPRYGIEGPPVVGEAR